MVAKASLIGTYYLGLNHPIISQLGTAAAQRSLRSGVKYSEQMSKV